MHRASTDESENAYLEALRQQWRSFDGLERPQSLWITCNESVMNRPLERIYHKASTLLLRGPWATILEATLSSVRGMSAMDYAVRCLGIRNIVLCGHSTCSGIAPFHIAGTKESGEAGYEGILQRTRQREEQNSQAREHLIRKLAKLKSYPSVAHAMQLGNLTLGGLFYLAESGLFSEYDVVTRRFIAIEKSWQPV